MTNKCQKTSSEKKENFTTEITEMTNKKTKPSLPLFLINKTKIYDICKLLDLM